MLLSRGIEVVAGAIGVFLLGVTVWAGLYGTEAPDRNFSVTFVFVTVWLGFVVASVLLGDVFRAFNPWRAIARLVAGAGFAWSRASRGPPALPYPERLGRWPAAIGLLLFLWLELVYGESGFQTVGLTPRTVAIATLVYSAYTFVGMTLFGIEKWCARGETFSVYFGMFARLAAARGARRPARAPALALGRNRLGAGARLGRDDPHHDRRARRSTAPRRACLQEPIADVFNLLFDDGQGIEPVLALRLTNSLFMALTLGAVAAIYWAGVAGMGREGSTQSTLRDLGRAFAHSFIPIGLAYLFAHYFSLVLFQEQAQFTFLLSDPLGEGSNFFGTADGASTTA